MKPLLTRIIVLLSGPIHKSAMTKELAWPISSHQLDLAPSQKTHVSFTTVVVASVFP